MYRMAMLFAGVVFCGLSLRAQTSTPPVLATRPTAPYPEKARSANVSGEAVVAFSIEPSGRTTGVHPVSGPEALTHPLADEIRGWRFVTPLPRDAEKDFVADYTYSLVVPDKQTVMHMSQPETSAAGGSDVVPGPVAAVSGVVRSVDNRQYIDSTPSVEEKK